MKNISELSAAEISNLFSSEQFQTALEANRNVNPGMVACGRVYLSLGKIRSNSAQMKAIESALGAKFMSRPYYSFKCLYMGYDNAVGNLYRKAMTIELALRACGISAFADADMD